MDAILIVTECGENRQRSLNQGFLFKLHIQKTYDHLNWKSLIHMLQRMGFGTRWIKGLRQGDPLSPFLFILAIERMKKESKGFAFWVVLVTPGLPSAGYLSLWFVSYCLGAGVLPCAHPKGSGCGFPLSSKKKKGMKNMLNTAKLRGWIRGFQAAEEEQILMLTVTLVTFEAVSRLYINCGKSFIYPIVAQLGSRKNRNQKLKEAESKFRMKWPWKFTPCEDMLWKWRAIRNLRPLIQSRIRFKVGNGLKRKGIDWSGRRAAQSIGLGTINNFFLHCMWTDQLWRVSISLRKIEWVKPRNINCWNKVRNAAKKEERWKIVSACIWWLVWEERNRRCFEDKQSNLQGFKMICLAFFVFGVNRN
ncbi:hypothetical protein H5410_022283 [Solanum commersonii]|uniref:Reverse transcriptase domain-containing protein n=1 Tax=Solanum commersonii TaxID=4109 RepID=A0A9J5ZEC6_SOLCO|nr:hypothetical protein H5410_022283 [Solanum commersonii]